MDNDPFNLRRFVEAQEKIYETALAELKRGKKQTHWIWFIFPQLGALGRSATAKFYGITSLPEAKAYLTHPILGPRLITCTNTVLACHSDSLHSIFGSPNDMKFRSCMTLFGKAETTIECFSRAIDKLCHGEWDAATLELMKYL